MYLAPGRLLCRAGLPVPALNLNFRAGAMPGGLTFTRSSPAWAYNSSGVLTSFATDAPRLDCDPVTLQPKGLLIEEARTNLLLRSAEFDNASWTKAGATITANAGAAPDGTTTADKLVEDTANSTHFANQPSIAYTLGVTYTASVHVKAAGRTQLSLFFPGTIFPTVRDASFDLTAVTATHSGTGSASIQSVGGGWYRCSLTLPCASSGTGYGCSVNISNGGITYLGDGASGLYLWGAQLEAGAFATSYVPTTTAAVTRAADVCSMPLGSWFNAAEGVLAAEWVFPAIPGAGLVSSVVLDDATSANAISVRIGQASLGDGVIRAAGVSSMDTAGVTATANAIIRQAVAYAANNGAHALNGTIETDTSVTVPSGLTRLLLTGSNVSAYWLRSVRYHNRRLPDGLLQVLTT